MAVRQESKAPDNITKAERRLADVCVLCGEGEGYTSASYVSVDEDGNKTTIHFTQCSSCEGGYWQ